MILSALVVAMLGVDAGVPQVNFVDEAGRAVGSTATVRGMVRTLPPLEGSLPTGVALDDGTPIYLDGTDTLAVAWTLMIGQYVGATGVLTRTEQGFRLTKLAPPRIQNHELEPLDGKQVLLEGRAAKEMSGAAVLIVDGRSIMLPKLFAWPQATLWKFVIVKGTLKRSGNEWILESSEWKPAERKDPPPKP